MRDEYKESTVTVYVSMYKCVCQEFVKCNSNGKYL